MSANTQFSAVSLLFHFTGAKPQPNLSKYGQTQFDSCLCEILPPFLTLLSLTSISDQKNHFRSKSLWNKTRFLQANLKSDCHLDNQFPIVSTVKMIFSLVAQYARCILRALMGGTWVYLLKAWLRWMQCSRGGLLVGKWSEHDGGRSRWDRGMKKGMKECMQTSAALASD